MEKRSGIDAVHNFWEQVWQSPQNYDAIDDLVVEDFVIISGGRRIEGREAFKKWAEDFSDDCAMCSIVVGHQYRAATASIPSDIRVRFLRRARIGNLGKQ